MAAAIAGACVIAATRNFVTSTRRPGRRRNARPRRQVDFASRGACSAQSRRARPRFAASWRARTAPRRLPRLSAMGMRHERLGPGHLVMHGVGLRGLTAPARPLDLGNSGTSMRLLAGLLAGQAFDATLVGDESLMRRPMERVAAALAAHGRGCPDPRRQAAGHRRRAAPARRAGPPPRRAECAGQVRAPARGPVGQRPDPRARNRACRGTIPSACSSVRRAGRARSRRRCDSTAPRRCVRRGIRIPGDFSSAAYFIAAGVIAGPAAWSFATSASTRRARRCSKSCG